MYKMFGRLKITPRFVWIILFVCIVLWAIRGWFRKEEQVIFYSDENHYDAVLDELLKIRSPGSIGHYQVKTFLERELKSLGFQTKSEEVFEKFPITNVMGIINPNAKEFLLLSCHYDSKYMEEVDDYVGATDAAVSCAILLNMAKTLGKYLRETFSKRIDMGLVLVFFDGHDTLEGINDGFVPLYGSRRFLTQEASILERIVSHYENTNHFHEQLADIEEDLKRSGQLTECHTLFYKITDYYSDFEDDIDPFIESGVPVLHIVPHTYPDVWHTNMDNLEHLYWPAIRNMNLIISRFVYEYMRSVK
ncbi:glutaminyl-peptide cyclotransferase-like protein isoform X2 [Drosophila busckii]|nr:glutaminyl-peptide cyclotransferase-like protein isoform X2 [Drosophila busckii]